MSDSARDLFLARVRDAVRSGNRPGDAVPLRDRGQLAYQGGGADTVQGFKLACEAAGGCVHPVADDASARDLVLSLIQKTAARRVLLGTAPILDRLDVAALLRELNVNVQTLADAGDRFFNADVSVSGVDYLIAETGSIVLLARPEEPRSVSLLPPVHIAVAEAKQILPDFFDLFDGQRIPPGRDLPSCVSVITGPSKTGDIELRLVTGVHGPGEVHVIILGSSERRPHAD